MRPVCTITVNARGHGEARLKFRGRYFSGKTRTRTSLLSSRCGIYRTRSNGGGQQNESFGVFRV
jgi:hypothetical protein